MTFIGQNTVKEKMVEYLLKNGWKNVDKEVKIDRYTTKSKSSQRVDICAKKNDKLIFIECQGDSKRQTKYKARPFYELYTVFGQAIFLLDPDVTREEVGIAIPHHWKGKLIKKEVLEKIFKHMFKVFLVSETKIEEF